MEATKNTNSLLIVSSCTVSERARAARLVVHEKRTGCPANRDFLYYIYIFLRGRSESTFQKYQDTDRYRWCALDSLIWNSDVIDIEERTWGEFSIYIPVGKKSTNLQGLSYERENPPLYFLEEENEWNAEKNPLLCVWQSSTKRAGSVSVCQKVEKSRRSECARRTRRAPKREWAGMNELDTYTHTMMKREREKPLSPSRKMLWRFEWLFFLQEKRRRLLKHSSPLGRIGMRNASPLYTCPPEVFWLGSTWWLQGYYIPAYRF